MSVTDSKDLSHRTDQPRPDAAATFWLAPAVTRRPRKSAPGTPARGPVSAPMRRAFGMAFKEARLRAGLTQREIATLTGVAQTYVSEIELANVNLTMDTMAKLAAAVGLDIELLARPAAKAPPKKK